MAQYRFLQSYTTNVSVGGVVGIMPRTFNVGQIVNGIDEGGDNIRVSLGTGSIAIQGASNSVLIPKSVLELYVPSANNDLIDPQVVTQNTNQVGMSMPTMAMGNATFSISSIDRTKFPLLSDQEISEMVNSANNQIQNVGFQRAIQQFQSGMEYRLNQNNAKDSQIATLISDLLQSKGINPMNMRGNQENNGMSMGMGMNSMNMENREGRRGKKVFAQNIRENVKNALSNLRERVGKAKEEVEQEFERTKEKIKRSFDKRNERKPDMSDGYYDLAVESIDVNSFDPANYPTLKKKRVPNFVTHAINLVRNLGLDGTIDKLERQANGQYPNRSNKPIEDSMRADYSKLKQDIANALKQLKTAAIASGTTTQVAVEVPSGMENVVITEQSIPRTSNPDESMSFDGRRRGQGGLRGFVNASGERKCPDGSYRDVNGNCVSMKAKTYNFTNSSDCGCGCNGAGNCNDNTPAFANATGGTGCHWEYYISGYTYGGDPIRARRLVCDGTTNTTYVK